MKRLAYLFTWACTFTAAAQSFPVKKVNEEYIVASLRGADVSKRNLAEVIRDAKGLYWFQSLTDISSFDGVNWKSYPLKSPGGKTTPFRINDMKMMEDGNIWLATETGIYILDRESEVFVPLKEKFPGIKGLPMAVSCFYPAFPGKLVFTSAIREGFYLLDWKTKALEHIIIDSISHALVPSGEIAMITGDQKGNVWGVGGENGGIWNYDQRTGKVRCSWKGELPQFAGKRFTNLGSLTWSQTENALWISHGAKGYLEKMQLQTGKSIFYSFSGNLAVSPDSAGKNRYPVYHVKIDRDNNAWIRIGEKYLVKLNRDITRMEYLADDPVTLPLGDWRWFKPEAGPAGGNRKGEDILLWTEGKREIAMLKKRNPFVRHIPFDSLRGTGVPPEDYVNTDGRQNIFFVQGKQGMYYILQQNPGRPKLVCLDSNLSIKGVLLNDQWKSYPAYFSQDFNPDTFYIAILREGIEPLDFRNCVVKDLRVDLQTFQTQEVRLDFKQRVWRYGYADAGNVYWLFSNGFLYSYDPGKNILDSLYICGPAEKGYYRLELIKGYDYPTALHKNSSTFWIDFIPTRELYKVSLKERRVVKIMKTCAWQQGCTAPLVVNDMYPFDSSRIYLQFSFSFMLLNAFTDSLTDCFDLFQQKMALQSQNGSGLYKDWLCAVLPSYVYLLNTVTGRQKKLTLNQDFKWQISQFNSPPLVNDKGEMVLMSSGHKGFLVFNPDAVPDVETPGAVQLSFIKLDNKNLLLDSLLNRKKLSLKFNKYSSVHIGFSDFSVFDPGKTIYEYTLYKGGDTAWSRIEGKPELTFSELSPGPYQLLLRAGNGYGDYSGITAFGIQVIPPFRQTTAFRILMLAGLGLVFYSLYRYRVRELHKLQLIRNNIASDLHDDIGSTLNSISIYSEVAKQQAGKDIPALDMIGMNSRKIIESMSDIVWTINPENDSFEKIIVRMRSFAYQLLKAKKIEFTFEADEKLNAVALPMQVRKNFYLVFKEAVTNLVKYSGASRVSISLSSGNKCILLKIRDNGKGIQLNPETQGNGLMNMKRRAEEINAVIQIESSTGEGTGIELLLKT